MVQLEDVGLNLLRIPHARAMEQGEFDFGGGEFCREKYAGYFAGVDRGPLQVGLAKIDPPQVGLPEVGITEIKAGRVQTAKVEPAHIAAAQVACLTGRLLHVELLDTAFPEQLIHRIV